MHDASTIAPPLFALRCKLTLSVDRGLQRLRISCKRAVVTSFPNMSSFLSFLRERGGFVHPKLKLFDEVDDNGDRGVFAQEDIQEGQQLVLVPLQCCLHMPTQLEWNGQQVLI